ncbi:manganese efflux pump [Clostridium sp.]|uniref:manganese efflux pump n=1 Tax=Clostridium sp. TaxID=1506 RepID=UPI00284FC898|nr:manganese efflux pump [Clostridium sp.]MDR3595592.1 manganese efflux pump [Clostridium sp.]
MIFLSSLLLAISINLTALQVSLDYKLKNIHLPRFIVLLTTIITTLGTLLSMYLGKFILIFFEPKLGNIFGAVLLSFTGIYFISENIRLQKQHSGFDTSYYFESALQYKIIIENPSIIDLDKSKHIDIMECINLSIALILNTICTTFAAGITGININLSVFFYFIISIFFLYFGSFSFKFNISKYLYKNGNLVCGIILILLGIYEAFI